MGSRWTIKPVSMANRNSKWMKWGVFYVLFCPYWGGCTYSSVFLMMTRMRTHNPFLELLVFKYRSLYYFLLPQTWFLKMPNLPFLFSSKHCSQRKWLWLAGLPLSLSECFGLADFCGLSTENCSCSLSFNGCHQQHLGKEGRWPRCLKKDSKSERRLRCLHSALLLAGCLGASQILLALISSLSLQREPRGLAFLLDVPWAVLPGR